MAHDDWVSRIYQHDEFKTFYENLQTDLIDTVYNENETDTSVSDIWDVIIREGLYQNLTENPSVAIGFLLVTSQGPTSSYIDYLDIAEDHQDVIVLVALSALLNDLMNKNESQLIHEVEPCHTVGNNKLGYFANLSFMNKRKIIDDISPVNKKPESLEFLKKYGSIEGDVSGLFDNSLIDYFYEREDIKYILKSDHSGFAVENKHDKINPTDDGCAFHVITSKRVVSIVGIEGSPDEILIIPLSSIEEVKLHNGWTKDRIELRTKANDDKTTYHIYVPKLSGDMEYLLSHLENKRR